MANVKGASKRFVPTNEQIEIAKHWLDLGFSQMVCATKIINPETDDPIDVETFSKAFRKQIDEAMHERLEAASRCFANAAATDPDMAARYINTRGRGYFKERFILNTDVSIKEQYDQILRAAAKGLISSEEAKQYADVIKQKEESALHKLLKLLEGLVDTKKLSEAVGDINAS